MKQVKDFSHSIDEVGHQSLILTDYSHSGVFSYGRVESIYKPLLEEKGKEKKKFTKTQWLTLITLAFGNFCVSSCTSLQAPFFPKEAEKKGSTATEYGFVFGIFTMAMFLTSLLIGKIIGYVSTKFLLNAGILTVGVTCILFGTLDMVIDGKSFLTLAFVISTFEGVGAATLRTVCFIIVASQFSDNIGTTFSIMETFIGVGLIAGPTIGGILYDLGGYGLPFWVVGSTVILDAIVVFFFLPDVEKPIVPEKGTMLKFWLHPRTLLYSFVAFTTCNYIGFTQVTLEPHIRSFHLSGLALGMIFAIGGLVYAFTSPGWGWLCDKKCSSLTLTLLGCGINIFSLLFIGPAPFFNTGPRIWTVVIALTLQGLAIGAKLVGCFTGSMEDTVNRGYPPDVTTSGLVSSMISTSQALGSFVGPTLGGYLLDHIGVRNGSMTLLIPEIVAIICLFFAIYNKRKWFRKTESTYSSEKALLQNGSLHQEDASLLMNGNIPREK